MMHRSIEYNTENRIETVGMNKPNCYYKKMFEIEWKYVLNVSISFLWAIGCVSVSLVNEEAMVVRRNVQFCT